MNTTGRAARIWTNAFNLLVPGRVARVVIGKATVLLDPGQNLLTISEIDNRQFPNTQQCSQRLKMLRAVTSNFSL